MASGLIPGIIFDRVLSFMLRERREIKVNFFSDHVQILFPPTGELSRVCGISRRKLLLDLEKMECQGYIERHERVGLMTTPKGNRIAADILETDYASDAISILGPRLFQSLISAMKRTDPGSGVSRSRVKSAENKPDRHIKSRMIPLRSHTCVLCGTEFFVNDRRRKYCDSCKTQNRRTKNTALNKFRLEEE